MKKIVRRLAEWAAILATCVVTGFAFLFFVENLHWFLLGALCLYIAFELAK